MRAVRCPVGLLFGLLTLAASAGGCQWGRPLTVRSADPIQLAAHTEAAETTVYVVGHGWHTGLVLPAREISRDVFPEAAEFRGLDYLEFGWGDEGFYRATKITPSLVAKAALWPTPSVMHVAGFRGSLREFYPVSDVIEVRLNDAEFESLCRFISESFEREEGGTATDLGPGLYGESRFYRARGKYYVPKTCNVWTAKALHAAGRPVMSQTSMTADGVLRQTRRFGRVLQESPDGLKEAALQGTE